MWRQIPIPPAPPPRPRLVAAPLVLAGTGLSYAVDPASGDGVALVRRSSGTDFLRANSAGIGFRLLDGRGRWLESWRLESEPAVELDRGAGEIRVLHERPRQGGETWPLRLLLRARLLGEDALVFEFELEHLGGDLVLERVHYPALAGLWEFAGPQTTLMLPFIGGERRPAPLSQRYSDFEYIYPNEALSFMDLYSPREGLYLASYDERFRWTVLRGRALEGREELELLFETTPFLRAGELFCSQPFVAAVHAGDWHGGADRYREEWLSRWWRPPRTAAWVKELRGLVELFFEFREGGRIHRHDPEELLAYMRRCHREMGLDVAHVCGYHEGGFDARYPLYEPLRSLGGEEGLRAFFERCKAEPGWSSDIYLNARLMDTETPWYREQGRRWACTTRCGEPFTERYNGRLFAVACPAIEERVQSWCAKLETLLGYGAEGLQVDQPHTTARECWDYAAHGHESPFDHWGAGQVALFRRMRARLEALGPRCWSWGEAASDLYSQFFDFSCCYTRFPDQRVAFGETDEESREWIDDPRGYGAPEVFRYTCPEIPLLQAPPARWEEPEDVIERLNLMWVFSVMIYWPGLPIDFELERVPRSFRTYLRRLWDLRHEQRQVLIHGRFLDERGLAPLPEPLYAKRYSAPGIEAVAVLNRSRSEEIEVEIALDLDGVSPWGFESVSIDDEGAERLRGEGGGAPLRLARNRAGLVVWRRREG